MTITQLEYVLAVDRARNFAEAARHCYITQPTLSMQIKKLEEELGVLIFDRSKKPVIPTDIGSRIIEQAREGLSLLGHIPELVREEKGALTGALRIGVIPTLSPYLVPSVARALLERCPNVSCHFVETNHEHVLDQLQQDELDIGLMVSPLDAPGMQVRPLFYEQIFCYMPPSAGTTAGQAISASELDMDTLLLLRKGHRFRDQALQVAAGTQQWKQQAHFQVEADNLETLRKLVDQQLGYTLLPELAVQMLHPTDRLRAHPFTDPRPLREISLVSHRRFLKQRLIQAFEDVVLAVVPADMRDPNRGHQVS